MPPAARWEAPLRVRQREPPKGRRVTRHESVVPADLSKTLRPQVNAVSHRLCAYLCVTPPPQARPRCTRLREGALARGLDIEANRGTLPMSTLCFAPPLFPPSAPFMQRAVLPRTRCLEVDTRGAVVRSRRPTRFSRHREGRDRR